MKPKVAVAPNSRPFKNILNRTPQASKIQMIGLKQATESKAVLEEQKAQVAADKQAAAANAENSSIFDFYPVTLSAIKSLEIHINSSTSNSANRQTWTANKQMLDTLYEEYYGVLYAKYRSPADVSVVTPDFLAEKCLKFSTDYHEIINGDITQYHVYMLKSLLEICTMLSELCIPYLATNVRFQPYFQQLSMNATKIKQQIKISIDTNKCDTTAVNYDEIKSNYNKPNSNGKLLAWYRRVEPNSPVWINNDINGKITIYSFNLNKWICAHPLYHKFAYDFVKINNVPIDMLFIIWPPATRSASQTNDLAAPQSSVKDKLVYLQKYFDNFNINIMEKVNNGKTFLGYDKFKDKNLGDHEKLERSVDFRNHVYTFIDLFSSYTLEEVNEIIKFLDRLNKAELYMAIESGGNEFKNHDKQNVPVPEYIMKVHINKQNPEKYQNKQIIQKIYAKIIEILMSVKDPLRNPYPNFLEDDRLWNFLHKLDAEAKAAAAAEEPAAAPAIDLAEHKESIQSVVAGNTQTLSTKAPASALQQSPQLSLTAPLAVSSKSNNIAIMGLKSNNRSAIPHGASGLSSSSAQTPLGTTPEALRQVRPPINDLNASIRQIKPRQLPMGVPAAASTLVQQVQNDWYSRPSNPHVLRAPLRRSFSSGDLGANSAPLRRRAFDGGARKYPAKKYRFASRKHSKRCKTTSHKKACRRKSHKHRRITRKR